MDQTTTLAGWLPSHVCSEERSFWVFCEAQGCTIVAGGAAQGHAKISAES